MGEFVDLNRHVEAGAECRQPFRPAPFAPQAVGLDEAHGCIQRGEAGDEPQAGVGQIRHRVNENLRVVVGRVEVPQEAFIAALTTDESKDKAKK